MKRFDRWGDLMVGDYIVYSADELTIDGHRCKKLDEGVYETCDSYIVAKNVWEKDERNRGLVLITIRENEIEDRVVYVVTEGCSRYASTAAPSRREWLKT